MQMSRARHGRKCSSFGRGGPREESLELAGDPWQVLRPTSKAHCPDRNTFDESEVFAHHLAVSIGVIETEAVGVTKDVSECFCGMFPLEVDVSKCRLIGAEQDHAGKPSVGPTSRRRDL